MGYRAYAVHSKRVVLVLHHVTTDKRFEGFYQQLVHGRMFAMARKKRTKAGQEPTGEGLTVHAVDDVGLRGIVFVKESLLKVGRKLAF